VVLMCAGCGSSSSHPVIAATPTSGLIDVPPRVRVSGAGDTAVVRASTVDADGQRWTSTTRLADLRRDPTRPLWTLRHGQEFFLPPSAGFAVRLDLVDGGRSVAHATITRRWTAPDVRRAAVRDGLYGEVFDPPGSGRRAAALVIGGSDGGLTTSGMAGLVPSNVVNPSSADGHSTAWTLRGRAVPQTRLEEYKDPDPVLTPDAVIRAERIRGPILTASGGLDDLWPSNEYTAALHQRLVERRFAYAHRDLRFENAGHLLGAALPYLPTQSPPRYGGSPAADEAAKAALWPRILDFMRGLGGG
jgi:BAAT / Acyl-CoA thioester hydrolase C terminal